jgi:hypothetical protein
LSAIVLERSKVQENGASPAQGPLATVVSGHVTDHVPALPQG